MIAVACICHVVVGGVVAAILAIPAGFFLAPVLKRYLKGRHERN